MKPAKQRLVLRRNLTPPKPKPSKAVKRASLSEIRQTLVPSVRVRSVAWGDVFDHVYLFEQIPVGNMFTVFGHTTVHYKDGPTSAIHGDSNKSVPALGTMRVCIRSRDSLALYNVPAIGAVEGTGSTRFLWSFDPRGMIR